MSSRSIVATLAVLGLSLAACPAAFAGEVTESEGDVMYQASPGEANNVTVTSFPGGITITDTGVASLVDGNGGDSCTVLGQTATCTTATGFTLNLGDLDDTASAAMTPGVAGGGINGEGGNDTLTGGPGADEVSGGDGNDTISASGGTDIADGGRGNDTISLGDDNDTATGGEGTDTIDAGPGDDGWPEPLIGNDGSDTINGGAGNDRMLGDNLGETASPGGDTLNGEDGDDILRAEDPGPDVLDGGPGFDTADYSRATLGVAVTTDDGLANDGSSNDGSPGARDNVKGNVERIDGTPSADTITGGTAGNELRGNAGDDVLNGAAGGDDILGGDGHDTLTGGAGQDLLGGERGDDSLDSADGAPDVDQCGIGADSVTGDGADMVFADCESVTGAVLGGPAGPTGPAGAAGPAGAPGAQGPAGADGRLVLVAFQARVSASRVTVRYVLTGASAVTLRVRPPRGVTVTAARGNGRAGVNTISWNRRLGGRRARAGSYRLTVAASAGGASASSALTVRLR